MRQFIKMKSGGTVFVVALFYAVVTHAQVSFLPYQTDTTGSWPLVTAIGDLNHDGLDDLVVGTGFYFDSINDYKLFIFYQNGSGALNPPVKYSYIHTYGTEVKAISIDDLNNDGLNDIAICFDDSMGVFKQNASGTLDPEVTFYCGHHADALKTGDLNNDGLPDIATAATNDTVLKIYYQTAMGFDTLLYPKHYSTREELDIGDVNNDGLNDVVIMDGSYNSQIEVYTQAVSGLLNNAVIYNPPVVTSFGQLYGIAIGDLNNDGRNDIVACGGGNTPNARIVTWLQDSLTGLMQAPDTMQAYDIPEAVEIADLNCDGKNEIIAVHGGWEKVSVYEQDSTGSYNSYSLFDQTYASHYRPQGICIGDINNDNKKDIAIAGSFVYVVRLMNDDSSLCQPSAISHAGYDLKTGINIFPNPASDHVTIKLPIPAAAIEIYSLQGKKMYSGKTNSDVACFNISSWNKGFYFIKVCNSFYSCTKKLIIN